jgi:cell wall-associated NlpC family hydrolase
MTATDRLDPRLNAYRPDLADRRLARRVEAAHFVPGEDRCVVAPAAPIRRAPRHDAALDTEALRGETVRVFEETAEGWAWGQLETDRYVGWLPAETLGEAGPAPTHRVAALRSFAFPGPDIKLPPVMALSLGARVALVAEKGALAETDVGFVPLRHLAPLDARETDWVGVAERFVGTPYLWGGRTSLGLDCSGLVQLSLAACGIACPRDSDMQASSAGCLLDHRDPSRLARGDMLFWAGHVGFYAGEGRLLHANAHFMATVIEPLAEALERMAGQGLEMTCVRRPA